MDNRKGVPLASLISDLIGIRFFHPSGLPLGDAAGVTLKSKPIGGLVGARSIAMPVSLPLRVITSDVKTDA